MDGDPAGDGATPAVGVTPAPDGRGGRLGGLRRRPRRVAAGSALLVLAGGLAAVAIAGLPGAGPEGEARAERPVAPAAARTAPVTATTPPDEPVSEADARLDLANQAPRKRSSAAVEPPAGQRAGRSRPEPAPEPKPEPEYEAPPEPSSRPAPSSPATSGGRELGGPKMAPGGDGVASPRRAVALANGMALPPLEAPPEVHAIIEAGNQIARSPYKWGGGHGKWKDDGYDCSGSVSYALAAAGLLGSPRNSSGLMSWGKPGRGRWVTIYTNPGHVYMVVAGIRFDTSGARRTGSRWQNDTRSTSGYTVRHPPGL
jgi:cell wall-associated NlpC family hydrolase